MTETPPSMPSVQRDTTFGWLAHLLALFTWFIGPLVIYLIKKDEDKYAAFHAKQALCWSLALTVLMFAVWILVFLFAFLGPLVFLPVCAMYALGLANLVYMIFAIVYTAQGKPFKYLSLIHI